MTEAEVYNKKKVELKKIVDKWWQIEDLRMDFQEILDELKELASQCPEAFRELYEIELLEIEESLRNDYLID